MDKVHTASIGPITTETAEALGFDVHVTAEEYTIPGLVSGHPDFFQPYRRLIAPRKMHRSHRHEMARAASKRKAIFEKTPREALTFDSWLVYSFLDSYETSHCPRCTGRSICEPALQTTH
jgi:hypothetical protein